MFVRILEYVAEQQLGSMPARDLSKNGNTYFGKAADQLANRSIENGKLVYEQAGCNRCHTIHGRSKIWPGSHGHCQAIPGSNCWNA